ncbi:MAG: hypothetical protein O2820_14665 [Planctomycetota bacterium]|nr:hypothetical protein [Planctomycetota bacterium]
MIHARCYKSIRRAAPARIFASTAWTRQYRKTRGGWQYYVLIALGILFLPILLCVGFIGFPAAGGYLFAVEDEGVRGVISIVAALVSAVVTFGHGGWLLRELVSSRSLAVATQLPIGDGEFLANRTRFSLRATFAFLVVLSSFFAAAAFGLKVGPAKAAMVAGLALIQWSLVASLAIIIPSWFPKMARAEAVGGMVSVGVMVIMASIVLGNMNILQLEAVRLVALSVLPTGWVFLLLEFGILGEVAITAWLFVPVVLTIYAATRAYARMKTVYHPWEITLDSEFFARATLKAPTDDAGEDDLAAALPESDLKTDIRVTRRKRIIRFFRDWAGFVPDQKEVELSRGEASALVRSREFLEPYSWPNGGLIERMVGSILTEREQRIAELMSGGRPEWSRRTLMDMGLGCLGLALIVVSQELFGIRILMMSWHVGLFVLFMGLRRSWPGIILKCSTGHTASLMGLVPITYREMSRAIMVLGTVRAMIYAPFAVAVCVAGVAGLQGGFDWVQALFIASKAVLMIVAIHQWWFIGLQPHQSSKTVLAQIGEGLLFVPVLIVGIGGGCGMLAAGSSELWSMGGAALMFGAGWFAQRWQNKRVLKQPIDFITLRSNHFQLQMQAQQRKEPSVTW